MDRSSKPTFNFVNLSHPDELKDEETQLRIRRLAMSEVGKARRKPKTRRERNEIVLEFRNPAAAETQSVSDLGSGEVDPFCPYPIELDTSARSLVANIFRQNSSHSRLLRGSWWPVGLQDPASFYNVLANSQLYIIKQLNGNFPPQDDALSLSYNNHALRLVSEKMNNPQEHTSNELLGTVGSFMCHHYILGAFGGWEKHRHALMKIIGLRGGIDTVTGEELRITLSWCDLAGAFSQDIPSLLPLPPRWEADSKSPPSSPRPFSPISLTWKQIFPMQLDWVSIFDDIAQLISLDRALTDQELEGAMTSGSWMEPTMYRLLAIRPLARGNERENLVEEVCRLGTMLFLAPIWRVMGADPVWTFQISRNLQSVLQNNMVEWNELKPLLIWTIYFAAIETRDMAERSQYVFMLAVLMSGMQFKQWDELMQVVKSVLWVEKVFSGSDDVIRDEVMTIATNTMGGTYSV